MRCFMKHVGFYVLCFLLGVLLYLYFFPVHLHVALHF